MRFLRLRSDVRVFVNYRKDDTAGQAGRLYDALAARYGDDCVFMDTDTIRPGEDYRDVLGSAVGECDVLIAVIGPGWLTATDEHGARRLESPEDWVRVEIESALGQGVRVIPALVNGAKALKTDELPESLEPLAHRQAITLGGSPQHWRYDVSRLTAVIENSRLRRTLQRPRPHRKALYGIAGAAAAAAVAIALLLLLQSSTEALGKPGDIVFTRNDGIYRMNADGTHVHRLFESGITVGNPAWSPDAKRIAFAMDGDIYVLQAGAKPKNVTGDSNLTEAYPTWSPDGKQIAFSFSVPGSTKLGEGGIGVVSAAGGPVTKLVEDSDFDASPAWSPTGNTIAFSTYRGHLSLERDIYGLRLSDQSLYALVYTKAEVNEAIYRDHPSWSPDGKILAFDTNSGYTKTCFLGCAIETLTISSSKFTTVASPPAGGGQYAQPSWIDGKTLLLSSNSRVWTLNVNGGTPLPLGSEDNLVTPRAAPKTS